MLQFRSGAIVGHPRCDNHPCLAAGVDQSEYPDDCTQTWQRLVVDQCRRPTLTVCATSLQRDQTLGKLADAQADALLLLEPRWEASWRESLDHLRDAKEVTDADKFEATYPNPLTWCASQKSEFMRPLNVVSIATLYCSRLKMIFCFWLQWVQAYANDAAGTL